MIPMEQSKEQLTQTLLQLAGSLTEDDLADPGTYALASQLVQILEPKPDPLPQDLIEQLKTIRDKAVRFKMAASATGTVKPELMERLVSSMKAAGLWKSEDSEGPKMLVHYSKHPEQLTHIDPNFHGSGTRGAERRRDDRIPRSYYYDEGTAPEKLVTSGAKFEYKVKHPDNVIDIAHPGSKSIIDSARLPSGHLDATEMEKKIKDSGFAGYRNSKSALPNVVALFHPAPVHEAKPMMDLQKAEDELNDALEKAVAKKDFTNSHILLHPVTIAGHSQDPHEDIPPYHVTVKQFGDHEPGKHPDFFPKGIQDSVDKHNASAPKSIKIKAHKFENKTTGDVHHVLLLDGAHPELHNVHKDVSHYSPDAYAFLPHISVSKHIHDKALHEGATADSLGIKIHPLEYRVGNEPKATFSPAPQASPDYHIDRLKKAEDMAIKHEDLVKKTEAVIEALRKSDLNKEADLLQGVLEKSHQRGKKEAQKKMSTEKYVNHISGYTNKVLGGNVSTPKAKTPKEIAAAEGVHQDAITPEMKEKNNWKKYGQDVSRDKTTNEPKMDPTLRPKAKNKDVKVERKPEIRYDPSNDSASISHLGSEKSLRHEVAHYIRADKGIVPLAQGMDSGFRTIRKQGGQAKKKAKEAGLGAEAQHAGLKEANQFAHPGEYETQGFENKVARRAGVKPENKTVTISTKDESGKEKSRPKIAADPVQTSMSNHPDKKGKPIHQIIPSKDGQGRQISHLTSNMTPAQHVKQDKVDRGEIKFDKQKGWMSGTSPDSKINQKARAIAEDPSKAGRKDAKTLMRSEDEAPKALDKPKSLNQQKADKAGQAKANEHADYMKEVAATFHHHLSMKKDEGK